VQALECRIGYMSQESFGASALGTRVLYERAELESTFLPVGMMLQLDRVLEIEGPHVLCEIDLAHHWVFDLHFPSDPIFPGSLLAEASGQAAAIWGWHFGMRGKPRMLRVLARFHSPVLPGNRVIVLHGSVRRRKNICVADIKAYASKLEVAEFNLSVMIIPAEEAAHLGN
jgi:3-hydroxymyristoyl/3-hydroxydecanoyl-(acyl carrier protein) dehydratase